MRPEDYWFETGTPSYLVELLKHTHYDLYELANTETDADVLNSIDQMGEISWKVRVQILQPSEFPSEVIEGYKFISVSAHES